MNAAAESRSKGSAQTGTAAPARPGFGTLLADHMSLAHYKDRRWSAAQLTPTGPITLSPAAHVLHYASTCFEGFKAYRWRDGSVHGMLCCTSADEATAERDLRWLRHGARLAARLLDQEQVLRELSAQLLNH